MPIGPWELAIAQPKQQSPLEILQERYARGEITAEEYEERRKHLQDTSE